MIKQLTIFSALIWISACASTTNIRTPLPLPEPLIVPRVTVADYQCVSELVAQNLVTRDLLFKERIKTLENIIKTTWSE